MGDGCIRGAFRAFEGEWADLRSVRVQWVVRDELLQVTTGCLDFVGENQPMAHLSQRNGMKRWRRGGGHKGGCREKLGGTQGWMAECDTSQRGWK